MLKEEYIKILKDEPWKEMESYFDALDVANVKLKTILDINTTLPNKNGKCQKHTTHKKATNGHQSTID